MLIIANLEAKRKAIIDFFRPRLSLILDTQGGLVEQIKFSPDCEHALGRASYRARQGGHGAVTDMHILHGLIGDEANLIALVITAILSRKGNNLAKLFDELDTALDALPKVRIEVDRVPFSPEAALVIQHAQDKAATEGNAFVDSVHMIVGIFRYGQRAGDQLRAIGITELVFKEYVQGLVSTKKNKKK